MINLFTAIAQHIPKEKQAHWAYVEIDRSFPLTQNHLRSQTTALMLCESGHLDLEIDFKPCHFTPSDMLCFTIDHVVRFGSCSPDFKACFILIDAVLWKNTWREMERLAPFYTTVKEMPSITIGTMQKKMLIHYTELIKEKYNARPTPDTETIVKKIVAALLYEIRQIYAEAQTRRPAPDKKEKIVQQFLLLVTKHFKKERRIEFYAAYFNVTPKYLSSLIRQKSGMTAGEWIDHYVVTEICILLRTTNWSVKEITDELNFPDQSFFGKYFKRHMGVNPKAYRKQKE